MERFKIGDKVKFKEEYANDNPGIYEIKDIYSNAVTLFLDDMPRIVDANFLMKAEKRMSNITTFQELLHDLNQITPFEMVQIKASNILEGYKLRFYFQGHKEPTFSVEYRKTKKKDFYNFYFDYPVCAFQTDSANKVFNVIKAISDCE